MSSHWREVAVADLQAPQRWALNGGPFGSKLVSRDYTESGVPVIRGSNLSGDAQFSFDDLVFVSEEKADELLANNARPGDLVFTQRGTLGQVGLIPDDSPYERFVVSQSQMKLTVDESKADPYYLYSYFRAPETIKRIQNLGMSSGIPHINLEILRGFQVVLPPLSAQRRVAAAIRYFDELTENISRRIAILEEMAEALYREWFVNFRFPGHEQAEMVESELGPIPQGWSHQKLGTLCTLTLGQSPKSEYYNEEGKGLPFHQGVTDFGPRFPTTRVYCTQIKRTAQPGDILFSVRAPVGRINIAQNKMVIGRGLHAMRHKEGHQEFLFYQLRHKFREEDTMGGGTIFNSVTKKDMLGIDLLNPPESVVEQFEDLATPLSGLIENLTERNRLVRESRDLLLPRLVTGEIDISALEPDPEAVVA